MDVQTLAHVCARCGICTNAASEHNGSVLALEDALDPSVCAERDAHLADAHTPSERMLLAFQAVLPLIPPKVRPERVRRFYRQLARTRRVESPPTRFTVEDALGSAALYRFWLQARHAVRGDR